MSRLVRVYLCFQTRLVFPRQPKLTPQLTPRRPPALADHRSSILFESCETISITSLGKTHLAAVTVPLALTRSFIFSQNMVPFFCCFSLQGQRRICSTTLPALLSAIGRSSRTTPSPFALSAKGKITSRKMLPRT